MFCCLVHHICSETTVNVIFNVYVIFILFLSKSNKDNTLCPVMIITDYKLNYNYKLVIMETKRCFNKTKKFKKKLKNKHNVLM